MSGTIIQIKYSGSSGSVAPSSGTLTQAELAYSFNSQKLFVGDGTTPSNSLVIGGKHFTDMLDHTLGTLTASSAILTDSSKKIDVINIDNITIDENTISTTDSNGSLILAPHGTGNIVLSAATNISGALTVSSNTSITGSLTVTGQATVDNININANTIATTDTNGDLTLATNGTGKLILDGSTVVVLPKGNDSTRPTASSSTDGALRYSNQHHRFEGVVNGAWQTVGGVQDTDKDTYITAEETSDDDTLRFYISGTEKALLSSTEFQIDNDLNVDGSVDVAGNTVLNGTLNVSGNTILAGNLTVQGSTTTVESTVTVLNDPVIHVGGGSISSGDANDRGISFEYGDGSVVKDGFFGMDIQTGRFVFDKDLSSGSADDDEFSSPWGDAQFSDLYLDSDLFSNSIKTVSGDLIIAPAGGDTSITGTLGVSGRLDVVGILTAASLTMDDALPVLSGGTGMQSFTGKGYFVSNSDGTAMSFITGSEYDMLQFNSSGVPIASNTIDGGTF